MHASESSQSKLEKFTFDMKMRAVYLRIKKQEALFRKLPNGIERSGDFIIKLLMSIKSITKRHSNSHGTHKRT
jgi:hypothetical protein